MIRFIVILCFLSISSLCTAQVHTNDTLPIGGVSGALPAQQDSVVATQWLDLSGRQLDGPATTLTLCIETTARGTIRRRWVRVIP